MLHLSIVSRKTFTYNRNGYDNFTTVNKSARLLKIPKMSKWYYCTTSLLLG